MKIEREWIIEYNQFIYQDVAAWQLPNHLHFYSKWYTIITPSDATHILPTLSHHQYHLSQPSSSSSSSGFHLLLHLHTTSSLFHRQQVQRLVPLSMLFLSFILFLLVLHGLFHLPDVLYEYYSIQLYSQQLHEQAEKKSRWREKEDGSKKEGCWNRMKYCWKTRKRKFIVKEEMKKQQKRGGRDGGKGNSSSSAAAVSSPSNRVKCRGFDSHPVTLRCFSRSNNNTTSQSINGSTSRVAVSSSVSTHKAVTFNPSPDRIEEYKQPSSTSHSISSSSHVTSLHQPLLSSFDSISALRSSPAAADNDHSTRHLSSPSSAHSFHSTSGVHSTSPPSSSSPPLSPMDSV